MGSRTVWSPTSNRGRFVPAFRRRLLSPLAVALALLAVAAPELDAQESGLREPGIIVLREVPPRIAIRPALPAPPFLVKTAPEIDVSAMSRISPALMSALPISRGELLSDLEAATIAPDMPILSGTARVVTAGGGSLVSPALAGGSRNVGSHPVADGIRSSLAAAGLLPRSSVAGSGAAIQQATRGLGTTIRNALVPR